jgi:hypothetical protein
VLSLRPLVRMVLLGILYFILLMSIAPARFYPPVFRFGANLFLGSFGSNRIAKYEPFADPLGMRDTKISVGSDATGSPVYPSSLGINAVREGYAPTALLIALFLATPVPLRERWRSMAVGLVVIQLFVAIRITVAALYGFSRVGIGGHRLLEVGAFGSGILHRADQIITGDLHLTFVVPVVVWLLIAVRFEGVRAMWTHEPLPRSTRAA